MKKRMSKFVVFISCLLLVYLAAGIGSYFTATETRSEWYESIRPSLTPPNWVFPIVWNILFFLIAISLSLAWISSKNNKQRKFLGLSYGINLVLNAFWSYLYFNLKNATASLIELGFMWLTIIWMIRVTWKINKKASWLLVPYLLWVSFASILNYLSIK